MTDEVDARPALPPGWAWAVLDDLGYWTGGGTPSKRKEAFWTDGTIPWVSPKDMKADYVGEDAEKITESAVTHSAVKLVGAGSVIIVVRSGILRHTVPVSISDRAVTLNQDLRALTPHAGVLPRYVQFYLRGQNQRILAECSKHGTTVNSIEVERLTRFKIPLPPTNEQHRIVARIEELFGEIEAGEQELEKAREGLADFRRAVLKAAVTGELTREWREKNSPNETGADFLARILTERRAAWERAELARLTAKGKAPKNDTWKLRYVEPFPPDTSSLPELPQGWVRATPAQLASHEKYALAIGPFGSNLKVSDYRSRGVPLVFVRHIRARQFVGLNPRFVSERKAEELKPHQVKSGDLLITKMGDPPGDATVYPSGIPMAVITADCIKWSLLNECLSDYFGMVINSPIGQAAFRRITKGVAQQKVSLENFSRITLPLPPRAEQVEIVTRASDLLDAAGEMAGQIDTSLAHSARLRQSILVAAFSGRLVHQDPVDEPASVLLERLGAVKRANSAGRRTRLVQADAKPQRSRGRPRKIAKPAEETLS